MQFPKLLWLHCEAAALLGGRAKGQHAGKNGRQHNWDVPLNIHKSDPEKKLIFLKERRNKPIIFLKTSIPTRYFFVTLKLFFIRQNSQTFKGGLNFRRYFHFGEMFEIIILNFFTLKSWKLGPKWKYLRRLLVSNL